MKVRNVIGLTVGFVFGWSVIGYAQTTAVQPTDTLECTFSQAAPTLADAQMLRVGLTIDTGSEVIKPHTCTGSTSPFTCRFTAAPPVAGWPVGVHTFRYRTGNVEADSTVSWGETIEHTFLALAPKKGAPATPTNSILRKLLNAIAALFTFRWIG